VESRTHLGISPELCGVPVELLPGAAVATLTATQEMAADARGLVHGGFVFGLADYAAMLAVNDPNVVLGAADCRFLAPVRVGEELTAKAHKERPNGDLPEGRRRQVVVSVLRGEEEVFQGRFTCFVLDRHVLDG
jgi:acyl-coenzyme A thioesterase PaaI-like protein